MSHNSKMEKPISHTDNNTYDRVLSKRNRKITEAIDLGRVESNPSSRDERKSKLKKLDSSFISTNKIYVISRSSN